MFFVCSDLEAADCGLEWDHTETLSLCKQVGFFFLEHVFGVVFFCVKWCFQRRNVEILLDILQPSGSYFFFYI